VEEVMAGVAFEHEALGLGDEFLGEVEGVQLAVAEFPERHGYAAGAAAGLEQAGRRSGKEAVDQDALGGPEPELVRGAGVVDDRE
jgi:hypothetical protein